jgi:hypothetical protein
MSNKSFRIFSLPVKTLKAVEKSGGANLKNGGNQPPARPHLNWRA